MGGMGGMPRDIAGTDREGLGGMGGWYVAARLLSPVTLALEVPG
eukprot:CAMPEP_0202894346 /NCGR_PEP_ID=MMETSP1392-20130828/3771_1 /ASSEMBLY_ACC=CAM_ASM_000868 /TAXON_ID=225041 /ORGANISM="Chlamydomonas chlamydogama, Strain SAG 11-48b" /LENGTH=43 /DNA_ID= /DNA_START= /DNA_END= /DNA_ORIENTATION=